MKKFLQLVLTFLSIKAFAEESGKKVLTAEQKQKLTAEYGAEFVEAFSTALANDFKDVQNEPPAAGASEQTSQQLTDAQAEVQRLTAQLTQLESDKNAAVADKADLEKKLQQQKSLVTALSNLPEFDTTEPNTPKGASGSLDATNEKFLFGIQSQYMAIDASRPYNKRAYAAIMASRGVQIPTIEANAGDYSALKNDLGDYYRTRKQDQIISFVKQVPSLDSIFPKESGYIDQTVLVNLFMTVFSQPYRVGQKFADMVKGSYTLQPEILKMYDGNVTHVFDDLKELERMWIAYLVKTDGSDAIKMGFVVYLLAEVAKQVVSEQNFRVIRGEYKQPSLNSPGKAIEISNGVLKFIKDKIAAFQIKPFELGEWTPANIVEYVFNGTMMIPEEIRNTPGFKCYMSSDAKILYDKNYEALYGINSDYSGPVDKVKFIKNIDVIGVPNMGVSKRIWWTLDGNIRRFEFKPNEMLDFKVEQQDWTLKVWSFWKESVWAIMVGKKYDNAEDQTYDQQMIFCNDVDLPADYFVEMTADDVTPSVAKHTSIMSVANTQATALTTIDDAPVGKEIRIKCGNSTNSITIAKAGNFSLLSAAWNPVIGDILILKKRSDGKFLEMARFDKTSGIFAFAADDTSPDVSAGDTFITNANTDTTEILTLDNAIYGRVYTIYGAGSTDASTISNAGNFVLTAAMTLDAGTFIKLQLSSSDDKFYEIERG
jgi:hypothetical protein